MSQRISGHKRKAGDNYETPAWVVDCLLNHCIAKAKLQAAAARKEGGASIDGAPPRSGWIGDGNFIWEPAAGRGKMVAALRARGYRVHATDIKHTRTDFLKQYAPSKCIVTNPPYSLAQEFIEHALALTKPYSGMVAMLLRTDYDHAKTRQHLFGDCLMFKMKIVLTTRIVWFERKGAAPSFNHAWFIWNWKNKQLPVLLYAQKESV